MARKKARRAKSKVKKGAGRKAARKPARKIRARKASKKKLIRKRPARKPIAKKPTRVRKPVKAVGKQEVEVGKVNHYYTHISVAVVNVTAPIKVGDRIRIKGHTTDFTQKVESMQIEHERIQEARKGQSIGMKVKDHVRQHDVVYRVG